MLQRMNTRNAIMNRRVAIMLLKIMNAVPAIIMMLASCKEINVPAFILLLYLSKIQYIILLPFAVVGPTVSVAWSM